MAWCSLDRASQALDCSVRTVQRRIKSRGWDTERRKGEDGRYRLFVDLPEAVVDEEEVLGHAEVSGQPQVPLSHKVPKAAAVTKTLQEVRDELKAVHQLLDELPQRLAEAILSRRGVTKDDRLSRRGVTKDDRLSRRGVTNSDTRANDTTPAEENASRDVTRHDTGAGSTGWDGAQLRAWRKQQGLSLRALADRLGCHKSAIGRWERGQREPSDENLQALREAGFDA